MSRGDVLRLMVMKCKCWRMKKRRRKNEKNCTCVSVSLVMRQPSPSPYVQRSPRTLFTLGTYRNYPDIIVIIPWHLGGFEFVDPFSVCISLVPCATRCGWISAVPLAILSSCGGCCRQIRSCCLVAWHVSGAKGHPARIDRDKSKQQRGDANYHSAASSIAISSNKKKILPNT